MTLPCVTFHAIRIDQSSSCCVNSGSSFCTSAHVFWPSIRLCIAVQIVSSSDRTCLVLSRSRRVYELSLTDWKSTVMPSGVPSSSFREYRLPIDAPESSTRLEIPSRRNFWLNRFTRGFRSGWPPDKGTSSTLVGAIGGGKERT